MKKAKIPIHQLYPIFSDSLAHIYSPEEIRSILSLLIEHYLKMTRVSAYLNSNQELSESQWNCFKEALDRLVSREPLQYILKEVVFGGMVLKIGPGVLIPRPETEEMVTRIIRDFGVQVQPWHSLLDIGTGSGCLALALKQAFPSLTVSAMDHSVDALTIARENANRLSLDIQFIHDDIISPDYSMYQDQYDFIVSNPPYIPLSEKSLMHENVTAFEPEEALFVPDNDPLLFYHSIRLFISTRLNKEGVLFLEIHERYSIEVLTLFSKMQDHSAEIHKDFRGKDRFLILLPNRK